MNRTHNLGTRLKSTQDISFSLLMTNYNNEKYIEEAINSVISQTYSNWELIIVDDCSTDNSIQIITPYLRNKKIKLASYLFLLILIFIYTSRRNFRREGI